MLIDHGHYLDFDQLFGFTELQHGEIGRRRLVVEGSEVRIDDRARFADVAHARPRPEDEHMDNILGRGAGGFGLQTDLAASVVLTSKLVSHWNAGATFVPHAKDAAGDHAFSTGYNLGQSFIWLVHPRVNLMLETVYGTAQSVVANDKTEWARSLFVSPGVRWSYNFKNGLQIVPGIGVPIGAGPSYGEKALLFYLSFEHPFRKLPKK